MPTNAEYGDDIISFGNITGHYLHEILRMNPRLSHLDSFQVPPRIPKQERFAQIARIYHSVYIDILQRKAKATACRTLSWERREKSDRSDPDRSQCPAGPA